MIVNASTWDYYMSRMLRHLWEKTGKVFMACCAGGSALTRPSSSGLLFSQLLAEVPRGLRWLIPVICGNDLYGNGGIEEFDAAWLDAADELC
eukprot:2455195-Karenia_brevis.AAC.1